MIAGIYIGVIGTVAVFAVFYAAMRHRESVDDRFAAVNKSIQREHDEAWRANNNTRNELRELSKAVQARLEALEKANG